MDYIIVGQGLAGSLMSYSLWKRGKRILVMDEGAEFTSSTIAGGVYNPVTGRRLVKSWIIEDLLAHAESTYTELEKLLHIKCLYPKKILRLFSAKDDYEILKKRKAEPETSAFLGDYYDNLAIKGLNDVEGCFEIQGGGNLDTALFLNAWRQFLMVNESFRKERFDYSELQSFENHIEYKGIKAKSIIFCEGDAARVKNPWFSHLPFNPVKGEILTIEGPDLNDTYIYSKGIIIIPIGNQQFKVGATYNWADLTEDCTEAGKSELILKLDAILNIPYKIIAHHAGIRPAVKDRRPLIGHSIDNQNIKIFNGLGTKGVLLAPYFSAHFADVLDGKSNLMQEVDIKRFIV